jgi:membrane fusion protein, copper/silver efflux system
MPVAAIAAIGPRSMREETIRSGDHAMKAFHTVILLGLGLMVGAAVAYRYAHRPASFADSISAIQASAQSSDRKILYYRDPSGAPYWSAEPKKDANGRDYVPVYDDEEPTFGPGGELQKPARQAAKPSNRRLLYYRNPMGLPDTSQVPKKDWMGMDYIPVYEGEGQDDVKTVRVSLDKIQRSGVRTEQAEQRVIVRPVRAVGTVMHDESRLMIVTMRSDAYIEELFVNKTGQRVHAGEPLFRAYSPDIVRAQIDLSVISGGVAIGSAAEKERRLQGAMQQLRNLGVPEERIEEIRRIGALPRTIDWKSPATGDVIFKGVINGQRVKAGDEIFRIADHTHLWVIADVAEADLPYVERGTAASLTFRAYPMQTFEGEVTFIYPELKTETRTARVRIEVPNLDGRLKIDMYADVVFHTGTGEEPCVAVPISAVIDSGTRQVVLVAKGEGRFEPRPVKLGRRGDGFVEVMEGVDVGEDVGTSATFLIDAESNLKAALQAFTQPEAPK